MPDLEALETALRWSSIELERGRCWRLCRRNYNARRRVLTQVANYCTNIDAAGALAEVDATPYQPGVSAPVKVTEAQLTYVAVDGNRRPRALPVRGRLRDRRARLPRRRLAAALAASETDIVDELLPRAAGALARDDRVDARPREIEQPVELPARRLPRECRARASVVDARTAERFTGQMPSGYPGVPGGHMPGAINIPWSKFIEQSGQFRFADAARAISAPVMAPSSISMRVRILSASTSDNDFKRART